MVTVFLGMGLLGSNFAKAALKKQQQVRVWNRTAAKAKALEADGAVAFENAADAVKGAERIHIILKDDAAVDAVLEQALPSLQPGAIIIDHTTTSVAGAIERTEKYNRLGYTYQHAPVFMGPANALESTGFMLISGEQQLVEKLTPELSAMTGKLINLGAEAGKAAGMKLVGNCFLVGFAASLADMLMLAKAVNIPYSEVVNLLQNWNPAAGIFARMDRMAAKDYNNPTWNLDMASKDTGLFVDAAAHAGLDMLIMPAILQEMERLKNNGHGNDDWTIIAKDAIA